MALTRKLLAALGLESEKIDEIITAHTESIDALKEQRDQYKAEAEKLPNVQKELDELKEAAEKNKNNPYKAQYEELKAEYEKYKSETEAKALKSQKESAYRALLKEAGVSEKRIDSILKVSEVDSIELAADGSVKDRDKISDGIKKEWADFIVTKSEKGASTATPPTNGAGGKPEYNTAKAIAQQYRENLYGKKGE